MLQNRVAVITGGATGIGRATALLLAQHGVRVYVGDYDFVPDRDSVFAGAGIVSMGCDVRHEDQVEALVNRAVTEGGR